jgi:hypothetical protein
MNDIGSGMSTSVMSWEKLGEKSVSRMFAATSPQSDIPVDNLTSVR